MGRKAVFMIKPFNAILLLDIDHNWIACPIRANDDKTG
jgi:hypothetical protein